MKKVILTGLIISCTIGLSFSQDISPFGYFNDALRFSATNPGGSTRIQSIGGSQIALGADISSVLSNPAGLGFYNRSEISITPAVNNKNTTINYLGTESKSDFSNFHLAQLGVAIHQIPKNESSFKGGTFGFSLTRINDFNDSYFFEGINTTSSIIDAFIEQSNGATTEQFGGNDLKSLAYFNYLIGPESILTPPGPPDVYFTDLPADAAPLQIEEVETSGKQYQWSFSYGANFNDKLYFGLGLGIVSLNYESRRIYEELYDVGPIFDMVINENLSINGTGVNGTFGFIFRPNQIFRIGGSFTTPTSYSLEDTYDAVMASNWDNYLYEDAIDGDTLLTSLFAQTDILVSEYRVVTPWKLSGGLAVFLNKYGFLSFDVEYNDYSTAKLKSDNIPMEDDNAFINQYAGNALNIRTGLELRFGMFRIRGGYGRFSTPQSDIEELSGNGNTFSGGIGFKIPVLFIDLGVTHSDVAQGYVPYYVENRQTPVANFNRTNTRFLITLGTNF